MHDKTRNAIILAAIGCAIVAAAGFATFARAEARPPSYRMVFEDSDTNKDGRMSLNEYKQFQNRLFADADADGDGFVSASEWEKWNPRLFGVNFIRTDRGRVRGILESMFPTLDANGDGRLTRAELIGSLFRGFAEAAERPDGALNQDAFSGAYPFPSDVAERLVDEEPPVASGMIGKVLPVVTKVAVVGKGGAARPRHVLMNDGTRPGYLFRSFVEIPVGLAWGPDDKLYIADWAGRHVVRLDPADGSLDDLGLWRDFGLWQDDGPRDLAFDSAGNLYVNNHNRIYVVGADGAVRELKGVRGTPIAGVDVGPDDALYYSDRGRGRVIRVDADGRQSLVAAGIRNADDLAFGPGGVLYVAQMALRRVVRVDLRTGVVREVATDFATDESIYVAVDADGDAWLFSFDKLHRISPDGTELSFEVGGRTYKGDARRLDLRTSGGIVFDDKGGLWVASYASHIWHLKPGGAAARHAVRGGRRANARSCPSLKCAVVAVLPSNTVLAAARRVQGDAVSGSSAWYRATRKGADIYVHGSLVAAQSGRGMTQSLVTTGLEPSELEVGARGEVYVYSTSTHELWRLAADGTREVLLTVKPKGHVGLALDSAGTLFLGLPSGGIVYRDTAGRLKPYAPLESRHMAFGEDGNLYAVVGDWHRPKSLVRITGANAYKMFMSQVVGERLGSNDVRVAPAPGGLYLADEQRRRLYFVDFHGKGRIVAELTSAIGEPIAMNSAPDGSVYLVPGGPYDLEHFDMNGNFEQIARGICGDPWGLGVSPDGKWVYVAESGAIDRIPIH